jgi:aldehyde dehydrogenase (NAD+)
MIDKRSFYIGGAWVGARDGREHVVIDPSTEEGP